MTAGAMEVLAASPEAIARAAALLARGGLVAFPTETVYGLGADATDARAVARIYATKARPSFNPLIVHVADVAAARRLVRFDERAARLAARFWPGALSLVLPRRAGCPVADLVSAGLDTLAVRVPAHAVARALLEAVGRPLAAPSANPSGGLSPTTAAHVAEGLGDKVALVLDGGPCRVGLESTIVGLTGPEARLLRPGGVATEEIEAVIGPLAAPAADARPESPGQLTSHYRPAAPVRPDADAAAPGEVLLGFGAAAPPGPNLSPSGDLVEAAANLFRLLHELDRPGIRAIAVMPVPDQGLGRAINDRLRRASARLPADGG